MSRLAWEELKPVTGEVIQAALDAAGVELVAENGGAARMRFRKW